MKGLKEEVCKRSKIRHKTLRDEEQETLSKDEDDEETHDGEDKEFKANATCKSQNQ